MNESLSAFAAAVQRPDPDIDLGRTALLIAKAEEPDLDVERYLVRLDQLADQTKARGWTPDPLGRLHRLREFLFEEEKFRGNAEDYFDPRNSFLNEVLDRKLGIPITLSLVVMEVGRRLGLRFEGIGLPGHFVVRFRADASEVLLDPFHEGASLTRDGCHEVVSRMLGGPVPLNDGHFLPVTKRQLLTRMLGNLKGIYWRKEAWEKVTRVLDRLLVLEPDSPEGLRDRGLVLTNLGEFQRGIADWERYLREHSDGPSADLVRENLRKLRQRLATLN